MATMPEVEGTTREAYVLKAAASLTFKAFAARVSSSETQIATPPQGEITPLEIVWHILVLSSLPAPFRQPPSSIKPVMILKFF